MGIWGPSRLPLSVIPNEGWKDGQVLPFSMTTANPRKKCCAILILRLFMSQRCNTTPREFDPFLYRTWQINRINGINKINRINNRLIYLCKLGPGLIRIDTD